MLAGPDVDAGSISILRHDSVRSHIDPVGVGIFGDDEMTGAQTAAAILLVKQGRGKLEQIDSIAVLGVFLYRSTINFDSMQRHTMLHSLVVHAGEL